MPFLNKTPSRFRPVEKQLKIKKGNKRKTAKHEQNLSKPKGPDRAEIKLGNAHQDPPA